MPYPNISLAFQAAQDMIFHGRRVPNAYTGPTLHRRRRQLKAALRGYNYTADKPA